MMKTTVQYLLNQPYMKDARVLTGKAGLLNQVDGVSFLEKDETVLLKNTFFILDAFFFDLYHKEKYKSVLKTFSLIKTSALCFKMQKKEDIPEAFTEEAEKLGITVIFISQETIISSLVTGIVYDILMSNGYNFSSSFEDNFIQETILAEQDRYMIIKRARMLGIKVDEYLGMIMLDPQGVCFQNVYDICKQKWGCENFMTSRNGLILVAVRIGPPFETAPKRLNEAVNKLYDLLKLKYPAEDIHIGVGNCYKDISNLRKSFYEARAALIAGRMQKKGPGVVLYDSLGIFRVLFDIKNRDELYRIRDETINPIKEYDAKNGTDYLKTIETFLEQSCSVQETAKALFVHYNTIRYRLEKIDALFGRNLNQMDSCVYLYLGLHADEYLIDNVEN